MVEHKMYCTLAAELYVQRLEQAKVLIVRLLTDHERYFRIQSTLSPAVLRTMLLITLTLTVLRGVTEHTLQHFHCLRINTLTSIQGFYRVWAPYRSVAYRALLKVHLRLLDTLWRTRPPLWVYGCISRYLKHLDVAKV